jgi:threonine dehydrogenase-like Zn-dependent dehydrogenase
MQNQESVGITVVGAGGVGGIIIDLLYSLGYEKVRIFDFDEVERRNLTRQNFGEEDILKNKAEILAERYGYQAIPTKFTVTNPRDIIICCVDNPQGRIDIKKARNKWKIYAANEKYDAEAYIGCDQTYEICKEAFTTEGFVETPHCGEDPQTKLGNMTAAVFAMQLLQSLPEELVTMSPIMYRLSGKKAETVRYE